MSFLEPYSNLIGASAAVPSVLLHLTGLIPCYYVHKCRDPTGFPSDMFFANIFIAGLGIMMANLINDTLLLVTYLIYITLNGFYLSFFAVYSRRKFDEVFVPALIYCLLTSSLYGYILYEQPEAVVMRFGIIQTILVMLIHLYPYLDLKKRIQREEEIPTPLPIILISVCILTLWVLYGIGTDNIFVIIQNMASILLCLVQLLYNIMYSEMETT